MYILSSEKASASHLWDCEFDSRFGLVALHTRMLLDFTVYFCMECWQAEFGLAPNNMYGKQTRKYVLGNLNAYFLLFAFQVKDESKGGSFIFPKVLPGSYKGTDFPKDINFTPDHLTVNAH